MLLNGGVWSWRWVMAVSTAVSLAASMAVSGCSSSVASDDGPVTVPTLAGVGSVPEDLSSDPASAVIVGTTAPRLELLTQPDLGPVAAVVSGNRLLVIGDSITASTTERYGGEMCTALSMAGWQVEIAAEVGKHIEYAQEVLAERFAPDEGRDLDAVVINLGTNFRGDHLEYQQGLEQIVDGLGDRQVVLVTVTEFNDDRVGVNSVIVDALIGRPNVRVVDWAGVTRAEPAALQTDRIHLSNYGRSRLVEVLADELGEVVGTGQCLSGPVRSETLPPPEELLVPDAPGLSDPPGGSDPLEDPDVPEDPDLPDGSDLEQGQDS
jgi:hypothetical protein